MEGPSVIALHWTTYLWVFGLAILGGMVGFLNRPGHTITWRETGIIVLTSCFNGFMIFCVCLANEMSAEVAMFACGVVGMMGRRAWFDFEKLLRVLFNIPQSNGYDYPTSGSPENYPHHTQDERGGWGDDPINPRAPPSPYDPYQINPTQNSNDEAQDD